MYRTVIGFIGMLMILFAFIMNQLHKWSEDDLIYDITNFVGAFLMSVYAYLIPSWPFLILNSVWAAVSLRDVILDIRRK